MPGRADVRIVKDEIVVTPWVGLLPEMKSTGARARGGMWVLPASQGNLEAVRDLLPEEGVPDEVPVDLGDQDAGPEELYGYQRAAAGRLAAARRGLLLVMSPGLGKTAVAIAAADLVTDDQVVVVAPSSLLLTWEREVRRWSRGGRVFIATGPEWWKEREAETARWILVSWDRAARAPDVFGKGWPLLILDESVLAKSRDSKRYKAMLRIRRGFARVWELSGSPTTRHADDLWAQLHLIWPEAFPSYWRFAERYCVVEQTVWARTVVATRAGRSATLDNRDLVLVVNQADVLDLPEYLFEAVDVELLPKQRRAHDALKAEMVAHLEAGDLTADGRGAALTFMQVVTSYCEGQSAKHDALVSLLDQYEGPHLIWTHWRESATALAARLRDAGRRTDQVDGTTPLRQRDEALERFKRGEVECLVLSIGVGKFGHTLTSARTVHYVDKTWNADDYFQSLRRVRRIGLDHRPVVVTYRAPGTVDDLVEANLEGKLGSIARVNDHDLRELLLGLGKETK